MLFKERVLDIINTNGEYETLELTDQRGVFEYKNETITFQRLPELEQQLHQRFGDHSFCAYRSNQCDNEFGEMQIHFTLTHTFVVEFDFWLLNEGIVEYSYNQLHYNEGKPELSWLAIDAAEVEKAQEILSKINEEILSYAKRMPVYRLFFATSDVFITYK